MTKNIELNKPIKFGVFICLEGEEIHTHPYTIGEYENTLKLIQNCPYTRILYTTEKRPLTESQLIGLMNFDKYSQEEKKRTVDFFINSLKE